MSQPSNGVVLVARLTLGVLLLGAGVLSFAGWGISGTRSRNSYELVRSVRSLDLLNGVWASLAPVWFALPLLLALGLVAVGYGRLRIAAAVALTCGTLLIFGWWQVKISPLRVDTSAAASAILGVCLIASSGVLVALSRGSTSG